jgi:hypothetical protein
MTRISQIERRARPVFDRPAGRPGSARGACGMRYVFNEEGSPQTSANRIIA